MKPYRQWPFFCLVLVLVFPALGLVFGHFPLPWLGLAVVLIATAAGLWHVFAPTGAFKNLMQSNVPVVALVLTQCLLIGIKTFSGAGQPSMLLVPVATLVTVLVLEHTRQSSLFINMFLLALMGSLAVWQDMWEGGLYVTGGLLLLCLAQMFGQSRLSWPELSFLLVPLVFLSAADSWLVYLPLLVGFTLLAVWPVRGVIVALGGMALTLLFLHSFSLNVALMEKGGELFDSFSIPAACIVLFTLAAQMLYHWRWWPPHLHLAWGAGGPVLILALAQLFGVSDVGMWKGASWLSLVLPVVVFSLTARICHENRTRHF